MHTVFKSKIGPFFLALFLVILVLGFVLLAAKSYSGAVIIEALILFVIYLFHSTRYVITGDNQLIVSCGFLINEKIDIKSISEIKKTNTILSAPAFSLDRLYISYGLFQSVIISPVNKELFLQKILDINPKIVVEI